MRTNYILIDFENVQPVEMPSERDFPVEVFIFIGRKQSKISIDLVASVQAMGVRAEYIRIEGEGPNALDFHISYFIGKLAAENPNSFFHIISKDKGFDPLLNYLRKNKIFVQRIEEISEINFPPPKQKASIAAKTLKIVESFANRGESLPRRIKKLRNTINAFFQKKLTEKEIDKIVATLRSQKVISTSGKVVSYHLPPATASNKKKPVASTK